MFRWLSHHNPNRCATNPILRLPGCEAVPLVALALATIALLTQGCQSPRTTSPRDSLSSPDESDLFALTSPIGGVGTHLPLTFVEVTLPYSKGSILRKSSLPAVKNSSAKNGRHQGVLSSMGLRYDRYFFDGPVPLSTWAAPDRAGVYAILVPDQLEPDLIYFGESGNLSRLRKFRFDPKYPCWREKAGSEEHILIAFHLIPHSTRAQRRFIRKRLITQYRPACKAGGPFRRMYVALTNSLDGLSSTAGNS